MIPKPNHVVIVSLILIVFTALSLLSLPWNEPVENLLIDLQFKLRGERDLSDDILFVFIGAEDARELGGWPITRDYYSYLTHVLNDRGAKVIGLYLIFNTPDTRFPEYDQIFADLVEASRNVCLPFAFSEVIWPEGESDPIHRLEGHDPVYPIAALRNNAARLGYSNLGEAVSF